MTQSTRILLTFLAFLGGISTLHGWLNLGWFADHSRPRLAVAHLPVT